MSSWTLPSNDPYDKLMKTATLFSQKSISELDQAWQRIPQDHIIIPDYLPPEYKGRSVGFTSMIKLHQSFGVRRARVSMSDSTTGWALKTHNVRYFITRILEFLKVQEQNQLAYLIEHNWRYLLEEVTEKLTDDENRDMDIEFIDTQFSKISINDQSLVSK